MQHSDSCFMLTRFLRSARVNRIVFPFQVHLFPFLLFCGQKPREKKIKKREKIFKKTILNKKFRKIKKNFIIRESTSWCERHVGQTGEVSGRRVRRAQGRQGWKPNLKARTETHDQGAQEEEGTS